MPLYSQHMREQTATEMLIPKNGKIMKLQIPEVGIHEVFVESKKQIG